jgi:MFS family permease
MIPLYFQVVLLESASTAGLRLVIPSLGTPIGGIVAGLIMSRYGKLATIVRIGALFMLLGNALIVAFRFQDAPWKYFVYLIPANIGTGMAYPGSLFTFLALFDHTGECVRFSQRDAKLTIPADHAVSTSTVYLIRSVGSVWGVAITSAITQTVLKTRLPNALEGLPDKWKVRIRVPLRQSRCILTICASIDRG